MSQGWMIRAGEGGRLFDAFEAPNSVVIGWNSLGNLCQYGRHDELHQAFVEHFGNAKAGAVVNAVAMIGKFRDYIHAGDYVIIYSPELRHYLMGVDQGEYDVVDRPHGIATQLVMLKATTAITIQLEDSSSNVVLCSWL